MNIEKELLLSRLRQLTIGRPLLVTPLLGLFLLFNFDSIKNTPHGLIFYFLIGTTWCLTFLYLFSLRWIKNVNAFAVLQITFDLFLATVITGVTGGVESPFSILYIVTIVSASLFFYQKGGVPTATAALVLLGIVVFIGESPSPSLVVPISFQNKGLLYRFLLHAIAFYLIGMASGRFFSKIHEKEIGLSKLRVLYEDIIKSTPSGVVTTDPEGRITSFNCAASEIIGVRVEEAIGGIWWEICPWEEIQNQYKNLALSGTPQRFEGEVRKKNGGHCFLGVTISPLRNDRGETIGVIGIFQDLTHVKKLEEEMNQKRWLAMVGEMAAGMAHEIRNPLTALSGSVQLLKNEFSLSDENRRLMEIVLHETDRLNNIITEFILYAKPLPPRRKWVLLKDLIEESMELIKKSPEATDQVRVILDIEEASLLLFIDSNQMKQVFWNLAINAFQAMPDGGTLTLTTRKRASDKKSLRRGGDNIEIVFQDTGSGIEKEDMTKVFYPFFTTKISGSGLGLPLVQRVIDQHEGTLELESSPMGTTVRIILPFTAPQLHSESSPSLLNKKEGVPSV